MFGWLKRRRVIELRKLIIQNFKAATDAEILFSCLMKGGVDLTNFYQGWARQANEFAEKFAHCGALSSRELEAGLATNKDLRRLYGLYGRKERGSFDQVYQPLGGWDFYFEGNESDLHYIEAYWTAVREAEKK